MLLCPSKNQNPDLSLGVFPKQLLKEIGAMKLLEKELSATDRNVIAKTDSMW